MKEVPFLSSFLIASKNKAGVFQALCSCPVNLESHAYAQAATLPFTENSAKSSNWKKDERSQVLVVILSIFQLILNISLNVR